MTNVEVCFTSNEKKVRATNKTAKRGEIPEQHKQCSGWPNNTWWR